MPLRTFGSLSRSGRGCKGEGTFHPFAPSEEPAPASIRGEAARSGTFTPGAKYHFEPITASGVSWRTITRFEVGEAVLPVRVQKLRHALEAQGVLFIDSGRLAGGVIPPRE